MNRRLCSIIVTMISSYTHGAYQMYWLAWCQLSELYGIKAQNNKEGDGIIGQGYCLSSYLKSQIYDKSDLVFNQENQVRIIMLQCERWDLLRAPPCLRAFTPALRLSPHRGVPLGRSSPAGSQKKPLLQSDFFMREMGLEPTHPIGHQHLKLARLPIPPPSRLSISGQGI